MGLDWQNPVDAPLFLCYNKKTSIVLNMTLEPKIVLTTSNERVIAGVGEYTDDNNNKVCLVFRAPYIINLVPHTDGEDVMQQQYKVSFTKWIPYSSSKEFRIPYSYIVTIGEVEPDILNLYEQNFGEFLNDNDTLQPSDSSDTAEDAGVSDIGD
jgi:hypothetical protein